MNFAFAHIPGAFDEAVYMPGVEVTEVQPPKPPDLPPEVWQEKPADPQRCWDAMHAMCR